MSNAHTAQGEKMAEAKVPIEVTHHHTGTWVPKCVDCIGELLLWNQSHPAGQVEDHDAPPEVNDAVTLAPAWQSKVVMGQQMMACVAVPACYQHLGVQKTSPLQAAILGGTVIPGGSN